MLEHYISRVEMGLRIFLEGLVQYVLWPIHKEASTSPRKLLFFNNLLICIFSIALTGCSLYVSAIFYSANVAVSAKSAKNNSWLTWLALAIVSLALTATCIIGMRGYIVLYSSFSP